MKAFSATVTTDYDTYYIDYKPANQYNNQYAVWSTRRTAVYLESIQDAINQIEFYDDQDIERACLISELEHNQ